MSKQKDEPRLCNLSHEQIEALKGMSAQIRHLRRFFGQGEENLSGDEAAARGFLDCADVSLSALLLMLAKKRIEKAEEEHRQ